jgi:hypothetical protein
MSEPALRDELEDLWRKVQSLKQACIAGAVIGWLAALILLIAICIAAWHVAQQTALDKYAAAFMVGTFAQLLVMCGFLFGAGRALLRARLDRNVEAVAVGIRLVRYLVIAICTLSPPYVVGLLALRWFVS